jgi:hypothetical protein
MSRAALELEIIALRSQLAIFQQQLLNHKIPKPHPTPAFRQLWVFISKHCSTWSICRQSEGLQVKRPVNPGRHFLLITGKLFGQWISLLFPRFTSRYYRSVVIKYSI